MQGDAQRPAAKEELMTSQHLSAPRFQRASEATREAFGSERRYLFAPIYVNNYCINDCAYCGYRKGNRNLPRTQLSPEEATAEASELVARGVRRVLAVAGEVPEGRFIDEFCRTVSAIRSVKGIEWVGIEVAPMSLVACRRIRDCGADAFIVFQETYDRDAYRAVHPAADPKGGYTTRYESLFVAAQAGFEELGLGALYGLADPKNETEAMLAHARALMSSGGSIRPRLSFPRFRPSLGARLSQPLVDVSEVDVCDAVIECRLALPTARLVLTARERVEVRLALLSVATDFGAGGSTSVGGYKSRASNDETEQFLLLDRTSPQEFGRLAALRGFQMI